MSDASILSQLDKLIDWYEKHKPAAGQRIAVDLGPRKIASMVGHFFEKDNKGKEVIVRDIPYRGRILVAVGNDNERLSA